MFIPEWGLWVIGALIVFGTASYFGTPSGDYDFMAPVVFVAILAVGAAFAVGFLLGG